MFIPGTVALNQQNLPPAASLDAWQHKKTVIIIKEISNNYDGLHNLRSLTHLKVFALYQFMQA